MKLKNKVALITGAGRGLGKGIAKAFAQEGAKVVVNERQEKDAADTVSIIKGGGGDAIGIGADISSSQDVARMFTKAVEHYGTVDILINNAAITPSSDASRKARAAFLEMVSTPIAKHSLEITKNIDDAEWARIINVNLTGVFYCTREALKIMEARKYGKIVSIASIAAVSGMSFHSPHYSASKAGVVGFTRSVALEVIGAGVNVNCIACGGILTKFLGCRVQGDGRGDPEAATADDPRRPDGQDRGIRLARGLSRQRRCRLHRRPDHQHEWGRRDLTAPLHRSGNRTEANRRRFSWVQPLPPSLPRSARSRKGQRSSMVRSPIVSSTCSTRCAPAEPRGWRWSVACSSLRHSRRTRTIP